MKSDIKHVKNQGSLSHKIMDGFHFKSHKESKVIILSKYGQMSFIYKVLAEHTTTSMASFPSTEEFFYLIFL